MVLENSFGPCDFVLFGTKGDLARRKLLPSLYQLEKADLMHAETKVIGVARQYISRDEYITLVKENIEQFSKEELCQDTWERFSEK
jgi:glucose-6-phosphate 1-dehydrogenase